MTAAPAPMPPLPTGRRRPLRTLALGAGLLSLATGALLLALRPAPPQAPATAPALAGEPAGPLTGTQVAQPVAPASSVPLPTLRLHYREGQGLALDGTVPDEAERQALLQELARRHPGVALDASQLQLGAVGNPAWLSARLLPDLHGLRSADLTLRDGQLTLRAVAASEPARRQLGARLADIAARGIDVQPTVTVASAGKAGAAAPAATH